MRHERFAHLVHEDERRFVLHIEVAGQLQGRQSFRGIGVDRNRGQVRLERQLVVREDRSRRDRKRMPAVQTTPLAAILAEGVLADHTAARASHFIACAPTQFLEHLERFIVRHPGDLEHGQRASFGGKKEMLGHMNLEPHQTMCLLYTYNYVPQV